MKQQQYFLCSEDDCRVPHALASHTCTHSSAVSFDDAGSLLPASYGSGRGECAGHGKGLQPPVHVHPAGDGDGKNDVDSCSL